MIQADALARPFVGANYSHAPSACCGIFDFKRQSVPQFLLDRLPFLTNYPAFTAVSPVTLSVVTFNFAFHFPVRYLRYPMRAEPVHPTGVAHHMP